MIPVFKKHRKHMLALKALREGQAPTEPQTEVVCPKCGAPSTRQTLLKTQYVCPACGKQFDELVKKFDEKVVCPVCGKEARRSYSGEMFSATGKPVKHCSGNCKTCSGCR